MWRKIIISALVAVIFLTASCTQAGAPVSPPGIASDNSGGAIVIYRIFSKPDYYSFYVQRIGAEGDFLWGEKGVLIGSGYSDLACPLHAVSDGSGGAIVIWIEFLQRLRAALPPPPSQIHAAKIDSEGNVQWGRDIPGAEKAIPDGSGGIIIAFDDPYGYLSVLKIDSEGNLPWGEDGVSLNLTDAYLSSIASDNSGGVIVVGGTLGGIVRAHRVDSEGNILWQADGVQVCAGPGEEPQVVSDGIGGAIIAYMRNTPCEDGRGGYCDSDIYAQRIDVEGKVLWGLDGVPICIGPSKPFKPDIVDDGAGGTIIFFAVFGHGFYAQRVDGDGHKLWSEDVEVPAYGSVVSDGFGGAISVWCSEKEGRAQRLDAMGGKVWGTDGITWAFRYKEDSQEVSDGCGGVLISWSARKTSAGVASLAYVQRIDAEGNLLWGDEGILLNP
jgi:hypothetical protein